jgi:predicted RNA-binding protein with RPS1 domain
MIVGLAGRDIRRAMEIFLDFCKSGHITEDEIFKICQAEGEYPIPFHIVARVLMRMNRRFYDGNASYVKNIFHCDPNDSKPFYFTRFLILRWLYERHTIKGPINQPGYHKVSELKSDLFLVGLNDEVVNREVVYLLKSRCIIAENLRTDQVEDDDLISLAPAGFVHLNLVSKVDYLASVAEETYYDNKQISAEISTQISDKNIHYSLQSAINISDKFLNYLEQKLDEDFFIPNHFLDCFDWKNLASLDSVAHKFSKFIADIRQKDPWVDISLLQKESSSITGTITGIADFGLFVRLPNKIVGLAHKDNIGDYKLDDFRKYQTVHVRILSYNEETERVSLAISSLKSHQSTQSQKSKTQKSRKQQKSEHFRDMNNKSASKQVPGNSPLGKSIEGQDDCLQLELFDPSSFE